MNSDFVNFHANALAEVTNIFGSPFTYKGQSYNGVISALELSSDLKDGGLWENLRTQIIVAKCLLPSEPVAGETLFIGNKKVRIERVASDEVSFEIICISANY